MQVVVLYIKNNDGVYKRVDLFKDETVMLTSKIQDVRDIAKIFTDFTQTFTIPASKDNNKIFEHWYDADIVDGFDARTRKDALMELDFNPFKEGRISLNNVKMKNNKVFSYEVIFYGKTVNLKDLLRDDDLSQLAQLDDYTHEYSSSIVKEGLRNGLFSSKIIYPLLTHTKRLYFDSASATPNYNGNLFFTSANNSIGLAFDDLKPAIKLITIIEAIENKYTVANGYSSNLLFTRDFFNSTAFSNLYLWLSRNSGAIGGDENQESVLSRICKSWGFSSGDLGFSVNNDTWTVTTVNNKRSYNATLNITTAGANQSIPFRMKVIDYVTGDVLAETTLTASANKDVSIDIIRSFESVNYQIKWIVESNTNIAFTPTLTLTEFILDSSPPSQLQAIYNINGNGDSIATTSEIIITDNVPQIKIIDFLTGIFKMFNLTAYYENSVTYFNVDFDKIVVQTLDNFYARAIYDNTSGGAYDITKFVDTSNSVIERAFEYNQIDFEYEPPSTLFAINHKEQFNEIFGNESVIPQDIDRGTAYKVKVPFEHMKFERIFDTNRTASSPYASAATPYLTDILWGYSADGDFVSDTTVTPATGNYSPVLTKPLVFYAIQETGLVSGSGIKWISDASAVQIQQYYRPSNTSNDGTSVIPPVHTINFDDEIDEWNLTNYSGTTNSLFKKFYKVYIDGVFNKKKRLYKIKAYLPSNILINYRLNDEFRIQDMVFRINSISTNFKSEISQLELLNKL